MAVAARTARVALALLTVAVDLALTQAHVVPALL
jgi:hypothetical protein